MIKKLTENIHLNSSNYISALKLLVPILILFFAFKELPKILNRIGNTQYQIEAKALVLDINITKGKSESQIGSQLVNKSYKIKYRYKINDEVYEGVTIYIREELSISNRRLLEMLNLSDEIAIKVSSEDNSKSKFILN